MSTNYQITFGFDLLSRVISEFKEAARGNKGPGDSTPRTLHKLRRHVEIFGDFTEVYLDPSIIRKHRLERVLENEQPSLRTKYSFTPQNLEVGR